MNKKSKLIAVLALAVLVGAYVAYQVLRPAPAPVAKVENKREGGVIRMPAGSPQLTALKIEAAVDAPIPLTEPLNARVAYNENLTARVASPIAGRVVSLPVQLGDKVKAGDQLLALDSPDLGNALADAQKADADTHLKDKAYQRAKTLFDGEVLARKDLEMAEADYQQAKAESARTHQRLANLQVAAGGAKGENFVLKAPMGGTVVERQVNPGMEVRPDLQNALFVISSPGNLWVVIDLPEHMLSKVEVGHQVAIETDAYAGTTFSGRIERIAPTIDPATRHIQVRCSVADPQERLKPEMYARVTLLAEAGRHGLHVPNKALFTEGLNSYVFIERAPNEFEKRKVELQIQSRDLAFIKSGIQPGEKVVTAGALLLNAELAGVE